MINANKKRMLILSLICILLTCVVSLCFVPNSRAYAGAANVITGYKVLDAAQVRTEEPSGIRFVTEITDTAKLNLGEDAEYGVIIIPQTLLGNSELTLATEKAFPIETSVWMETYRNIDTGVIEEGKSAFNSVLSSVNGSLPQSLYNVPLAVRAYVKHGENNTQISYSENTVARSIAYVAKMAEISGYDAQLIKDIAADVTIELDIANQPNAYVYGDNTQYALTFKVGGVPVVENDKISVSVESLTDGVLSVNNNSAFSIVGAGETTLKVTVTSKTYQGEGNSFTFEKEISVAKKNVQLTEKELFDKYVANGTYTVDIAVEGDVQSVTFAEVDNAEENTVAATELTVNEDLLATGYYDLTVETTNAVYSASAVVADKVINNKAELKNWPYYIRPANWANNIALEYDGLIVLGDDIDWGGHQYDSSNKDSNMYINELAAKDDNGEQTVYVAQSSNGITVWTSNSDYVATTTGYKPAFTGTFDGLGHCISNLYLKYNGVGLFGTYCSGTVKNLALTGLEMSGHRKGAICFDFTGTAEDLFLEGALLSSNLRTGLLAGNCSKTPNLRRVFGVLAEGVSNINTAGVLIGNAVISDTSSLLLNNLYGIGNLGLLIANNSDVANSLFFTGRTETLQAFIDAKYNISNFAAPYWDTSKGFPIMTSAIGKLTKITLQATDSTDAVVTEVAAGSSVNIGIANIKQAENYINNQAGFSTITVAEIDGVSYENGVLTVAETVAVGTEIILTVTNNIDGSTNTLKLTVKANA